VKAMTSSYKKKSCMPYFSRVYCRRHKRFFCRRFPTTWK